MIGESERPVNSSPRSAGESRDAGGGLPAWFKICAAALVVLIVLKIMRVQVVVEIIRDGDPVIAALTEIETYYLPLGLLLVYILGSWIRKRFFGSRDV